MENEIEQKRNYPSFGSLHQDKKNAMAITVDVFRC